MVIREMRQGKQDGKPSKGLESTLQARHPNYSTGKLLEIAILYIQAYDIIHAWWSKSKLRCTVYRYCRATLFTHGLSASRASTEGGRVLQAWCVWINTSTRTPRRETSAHFPSKIRKFARKLGGFISILQTYIYLDCPCYADHSDIVKSGPKEI